jgi:hypothetical protein
MHNTPHSEATKQKMSEAWKTRPPCTEATRKKVSERVSGKKHPMYGEHHSEATRKKMSESHIGKKQPLELIEKRIAPRRGTHQSEETKKKIRDAQKGEKGKNWKGGISYEPYCPKFDEPFKERVRLFFGYICIECGTPQSSLKRKLHVHHIHFNKKTCCDHSIPLFVPLCDSCHGKTGFNRQYWEDHFTEIITLYYNGKCYFTENEMLNGGMALC